MKTFKSYLISDLAKLTHLSTDTIRFYEKKQLIQPNFRADNNYRYYDDETIRRLIFIKRCRALDMSIQEITELTTLLKQPTEGCQKVDRLIEQHITQVENKIKELQSFQTELLTLRKSCTNESTIDDCQIVKKLTLN